jgi:DNA-binding transcriptional LysR family regulator
MDSLRRLGVFVRVAELGSFTSAARQLGLTQPQVSRAVRELEQELRSTLFVRSTRRVALTPEGQRYLVGVRRALEALDDANDAVHAQHGSVRGLLRVTAPFAAGDLLAPVVAALARSHPQLVLDVMMTDRIVNLVEESVDVAVRVGPLPPSELKAIAVATNVTILCAAPPYLASHPAPRQPRDLAAHQHVVFTGRPQPDQAVLIDDKRRIARVRIDGRVRVNELRLALAAAIDGLGIASLPASLAAAALVDGRLVRVLPSWTFRPSRVHLVSPPRSPQPARVAAFVAAFQAALRVTASGRRRALPPTPGPRTS